MLRRVWIAGLLITSVLILYMGRLVWLQLIPGSAPASSHLNSSKHTNWQRLSVAQRQRHLLLDTGRGDFYDRYGSPITGETYSAVAFFPVRADVRGSNEALTELSELLGVTLQQLIQKWDKVREPVFWKVAGQRQPMRLTEEQALRIAKMPVSGVRVLPYRNRYLQQFDAKHLIGFTSQHPEWLEAMHPKELKSGKRKLTEQVGGAGLEKSLDKLLRGIGETSVSYFIDGRDVPLQGLDVRIRQPSNRYYPLRVMTTIDLKLQNEIEAYADSEGLKQGAIVVLDANNADIVAMVSRPKLTPDQFESSDGSEWVNHALKTEAPGSVFKLVTEAAALESGVVGKHEKFFCNGEYGKYGLSCWKEGGHGIISLQEGLAQSCNIVFATIAERLRADQLQRTADILGIGHKAGWHRDRSFGPFDVPLRLLGEEEAGRLFAGVGAMQGDMVKRGPQANELGQGKSHVKRGSQANESGQGKNDVKRDKYGQVGEVMDDTKRDMSRLSEAVASNAKRAAVLSAIDGGVLAQSGIGQRDVRMSPLQVANLIVTLLNEGRVMEPRLVSEIRYANGQRMVKLPAQRAQKGGGRIRPATAHVLLRGMQAVVDHGTGRSIRQGQWAVAGKSGTAQTTQAGIARNHQWFAGYGPLKSPRYAIAVLAENRSPGSAHQATKLFRGVMEIAADSKEGPH